MIFYNSRRLVFTFFSPAEIFTRIWGSFKKRERRGRAPPRVAGHDSAPMKNVSAFIIFLRRKAGFICERRSFPDLTVSLRVSPVGAPCRSVVSFLFGESLTSQFLPLAHRPPRMVNCQFQQFFRGDAS